MTDLGNRRPMRVVSARVDLRQRLRDIWRYRELFAGLVRKELKVKYKESFLGFMWSMLNPATTLLVYYVVFQVILKNGIPYFAIYLACGVLVWNLFSTGLPGATGSVVANSAIVKKVAFPRAIYHKGEPKGLTGGTIPILPVHVSQWWYLSQLLGVIVFSLALFMVALHVFGRLEGNFAEEL